MATLVVPAFTVSRPSITSRVTCTVPAPASKSATRNPVLCRGRSCCSEVGYSLCAMLTVGASLTAATLMAVVLVTVNGGAVPVATASTVLMVRVSWPLKSWSPRYSTPWASASVVLMALTLPLRVTVRRPLSYWMPVLSRPDATLSLMLKVPFWTLRMTVMGEPRASGSVTFRPVTGLAVSSVASTALGAVFTGRT